MFTHTDLVPKQNKINDLEQIDIQIARIERTIADLANQKTALKKRRNSLIPASSLPFELLTRIFEIACFPEEGEKDSVIKRRPPPIFLGTICSAWRDVTLAAPHLWAYIVVNFDIGKVAMSLEPSRVRFYLKRAGDYPLSIKIMNKLDWEGWGWPGDETDYVFEVFKVLLQRGRFWRKLDGYLPSLSYKMRCDFPMLSTLILRRPNDESLHELSENTFLSAPLLRDVTLDGYDVGRGEYCVKLPYNQLESITIINGGGIMCGQTLRLCFNLRHCQFFDLCNEHWGSSMIPSLDPIRHDNLQSLNLSANDYLSFTTWLKNLILPSLLHLSVSYSRLTPSLDIIPLVSRSSCNLKSLHLTCETLDKDIIQCLEVLPSLITLRLARFGAQMTEAFLDALHPSIHKRSSSSSACLIPKLQHLEYIGPVDFSNASLTDFLSCRWRHALVGKLPVFSCYIVFMTQFIDNDFAQLMSVLINTRNKILFGPTDIIILDSLKSEGMSLTFP